MKFYFSHYGEVYSLSKKDAERLALKALKHGEYNMKDFVSCKVLKRPDVSRYISGFSTGKKWVVVHFCLDWEKWEWRQFLTENFNYKFDQNKIKYGA